DRYMYCTGDPVNYYDPSGATIDVDGDGRIDSEDSISETYIHMEPDDPRKAAQREKMKAAAAAAAAQYAAAQTAAAAAQAERERALAERDSLESGLAAAEGWLSGIGFTAGVVGCGLSLSSASNAGVGKAAGTVLGVVGMGCSVLALGINYVQMKEGYIEREEFIAQLTLTGIGAVCALIALPELGSSVANAAAPGMSVVGASCDFAGLWI
ncbi:MAG: hypothetical protein VB139_03490, partial [Coriobacteriia bacterium]|nr:hypothetical protein [Coriobacteriia bacterium]